MRVLRKLRKDENINDAYLEDTIRTYNKIATIYFRRWDRLTRKEVYFLEEFLLLIRGKTILDVGCGTGKDGNYFKERGYQVIGIELSEGMINHARKRIDVIKCDMRKLPLRNEAVDGIWSNTSLVHVKEKLSTIKEWQRVLKPGGIIGITIQNKIFPKYLLRQLQTGVKKRKFKWGYANYDGRHWWYLTVWELQKLFSKGEFEIIYYTKNPLMRWLRIFAKKK
jgi:ubiquinone/menaquinone biosynthesis C-methylase UbiE